MNSLSLFIMTYSEVGLPIKDINIPSFWGLHEYTKGGIIFVEMSCFVIFASECTKLGLQIRSV